MRNYIEFKQNLNHSGIGRISKLFTVIRNYVADDEVKAFYPKNFFNNSTEIEFYAFTDKSIYLIKESDKVVTISYFKEVKTEKLQLIQSYGQQDDLKMEIKLESGDKFNFDSIKDSNHDWAYDYVAYIKAIYELLN